MAQLWSYKVTVQLVCDNDPALLVHETTACLVLKGKADTAYEGFERQYIDEAEKRAEFNAMLAVGRKPDRYEGLRVWCSWTREIKRALRIDGIATRSRDGSVKVS